MNLAKLKKQLRFLKLIDGMREGKTFQAIADECGCSYHTVERDFWDWKDKGGFDKWLVTEFMILHDAELQKEGRNDAYRVIADLLKKRVKEEVELQGVAGIVLEWARASDSQSSTALMLDSESSTSQKPDSESYHAGEDGAKRRAAETKQSDKPSYAA